MGGCLAVFVLLGMLGTAGAVGEGNYSAAFFGFLVFFLIPIGGAAIVWHQDQAVIASRQPVPPPKPKPATILTCSQCFSHYPQTGRHGEWRYCPECAR